MFKYMIEVLRLDGTWMQGAVWACSPGKFREFLDHFSEGIRTTMRIKRADDQLEAEFQWPLTS